MTELMTAGTTSVSEQVGRHGGRAGRRRLARWVVPALVVGALVIVAAVWVRGGDPQATRYVTQPATRGALTVTVSATGSLAPTNQIDVGSELSGIVKSVEVDVNGQVKAGQLLAKLDPTRLNAQALQARASLEAANAQVRQKQATVEEARAQLSRLERASGAGVSLVASEQQLDAQRATVKRADADVASAQASVTQARAAAEAIETDLSKTSIYSPIDGVVLTRSVEPGQTVAASFQAPVLFTIAEDLTKMQLTVNVDEADVGAVRPGERATFTVDAYPDRVFEAKLDEVQFASKTISNVVTYPTKLYVENPELLLRPGMTATAEIVVRKIDDALLVPNAALRFELPQDVLAAVSQSGGYEAPGAAAGPSGSAGDADSAAAPAARPNAGGGGGGAGAGPGRGAAPGGRGIIGRLLPAPPGAQRQPTVRDTRPGVWILRDGQPVRILIRTGATDGSKTEVASGNLEPGTLVIVDTSATRR
jgi:HlyD family secretion protein